MTGSWKLKTEYTGQELRNHHGFFPRQEVSHRKSAYREWGNPPGLWGGLQDPRGGRGWFVSPSVSLPGPHPPTQNTWLSRLLLLQLLSGIVLQSLFYSGLCLAFSFVLGLEFGSDMRAKGTESQTHIPFDVFIHLFVYFHLSNSWARKNVNRRTGMWV